RGSQPLGEPQRVGRTAHIGNHPFRVVFVRPWKPLINEPVIRRHETSLTERRTKACKLSTNDPVLQFESVADLDGGQACDLAIRPKLTEEARARMTRGILR